MIKAQENNETMSLSACKNALGETSFSSLLKISVFIFVLGFFTKTVTAQQTLAFSQVLFLSDNTTNDVNLGSVPNGKVWKIVDYGTSATDGSSCGFSLDGGTSTSFWSGIIQKSGAKYSSTATNIWLPEGKSITALSCNHYRWVSIIEYIIVP